MTSALIALVVALSASGCWPCLVHCDYGAGATVYVRNETAQVLFLRVSPVRPGADANEGVWRAPDGQTGYVSVVADQSRAELLDQTCAVLASVDVTELTVFRVDDAGAVTIEHPSTSPDGFALASAPAAACAADG